jgi:hypothetical protein
MSAGAIWLLCLGVWAIQAVVFYISLLYWEYTKFKSNRSSWADRSFAEFVYEGEHPDYDNPFIWFQYIPYVGLIFWMILFFIDYKEHISTKSWNPIRVVLRVVLRKQYLLERVSKEI